MIGGGVYSIRVMTYNIGGCRGTDGRTDPARIMQVISHAAPDIVALQEVGGTHTDGPIAWLGERLAMHCYGPPNPGGNAFLSYFPLHGLRSLDMDAGSCLCADVGIAGKRLHLFNIRLHEKARRRQRQVTRLLDQQDGILSHSVACPLLVLGDFGGGSWSLGKTLPAPQLRPARRPFWSATFPSRIPLLGRDRAYIGGQLRVIDSRIYRSALARRASCHLPLLLTVRVADPRDYLEFKDVKHRRMEIAPG